MTYAITDDVAKQLGRPASGNDEIDQWDAWLAVVEREIKRGFKRAGYDLDTQVNLGAPSADDVSDVKIAAVIRKIQNPIFGETSYTRSIDDASETRRSEGIGTIDPLALTSSQWATLLPVGRKSSRAFSVLPS
jgi:hypothetical protein